MHLWFIWWGTGHGGCYLVWDDGHWGSWVGCVGFVWRRFLEAGARSSMIFWQFEDIQPRQDCISTCCSFIQKEVLNECTRSVQPLQRESSGHGWAWTCSSGWRWGCQHISIYRDVQFDMTIYIDDLDDGIVNKLMKPKWYFDQLPRGHIPLRRCRWKTRNPCWGCPYYGSRRAVAEVKRIIQKTGFCLKLLQFNPLITWRSCTNNKESQPVGLVNSF